MNDKTPTQQVSQWLAELGAALERGDGEGAAELFGADSYWRTWFRVPGTSPPPRAAPTCAG